MARTALPADYNIGVAVLHSDGSVSVGNGPRMRNSEASLEFAIGTLDIRRERVAWRPMSGVEAAFEYADGKWFALEEPPMAPVSSGERTAARPVTSGATPKGRFRGWLSPQHTAALVVASAVVGWFLWDIGTRNRRGDVTAQRPSPTEEISEPTEEASESEPAPTQVGDREPSVNEGSEAPAVPAKEPDLPEQKIDNPEGLGVVADELAVIVSTEDQQAWNIFKTRLNRVEEWFSLRDEKLLYWQALADQFSGRDSDVRKLAKEQSISETEVVALLKQLSSFDLKKLPAEEGPQSRPSNIFESSGVFDATRQPSDSQTRSLVTEMRQTGFVTRAKARTFYHGLVACQRGLARCAAQGRALERLAELIPLEKLSSRPGQARFSPPDGEVMAVYRYAGSSSWALPVQLHPTMAQEYRVLVNLNLSVKEFNSYLDTLLSLHPDADQNRYKEAASRYKPKAGQAPTRFDGSQLVPTEGLARTANDEMTDFWWLDEDLDDESEFQLLNYLLPSDSRLAYGLRDDEEWVQDRLKEQQRLQRDWQSRGGKKFTDEQLQEFKRRFVQWQLIGWRYREKLQSRSDASLFEKELQWWEDLLK